MKTDLQLKNDVIAELEWDPAINVTHVGVMAHDGVVTLTGHLDTYTEKIAIERAVQRVEGVKAVALELDVKLDPAHKRSDSEIAEAVETAFKWHTSIPADRIMVKVEKGAITLTGEVDWEYQRAAAMKALRPLIGVVAVTNNITLKEQIVPKDITSRIRSALARQAEQDAKNIEVMVSGATVTLRGKVNSWADRAAIGAATWAAPGVSRVVNNLEVAR